MTRTPAATPTTTATTQPDPSATNPQPTEPDPTTLPPTEPDPTTPLPAALDRLDPSATGLNPAEPPLAEAPTLRIWRSASRRGPTELGQATAEYALVMLAAAALAGLLLVWAAGTDGIGRLLDAVMDTLISQVTS